jgi:hypothetical protein
MIWGMNIGCEKHGNFLPFRGTILEDIQKMAVNEDSISTAIQNMTDCNTVCSLLRQLPRMDLTLIRGKFLIEAVKYTRYDLLTAMVRELKFSVDSVYVCYHRRRGKFLCWEGTALSASARVKNRQMSKFLIQELKADVNKTWFRPCSQRTCSVLTALIERRDLDELKFFLVSVLYNSFSY